MWFLLLLLLHSFAHSEAEDLKDPSRVVLQNKNNISCEGHVEIFYNNKWGYVGDKHWNEKTEKVACRSTHCGEPVQNSTSNVRRSMKHEVWLNELKCTGNEMDLWDCPGWPGPGVSFYKKPTVKKIKCSNNVHINLRHVKDHVRCEGVVQYFINGKKEGYICEENFGRIEAEHLCQSLNCGEFKEMLKANWMTPDDFQNSKKMMINCSGINKMTHLWQCVRSASKSCHHPASVSCYGHKRVQLEGNSSNVCSGNLQEYKNTKWENYKGKETDLNKLCEQMHCGASSVPNQTEENLTCGDSVRVVLMNNNKESKCYGEVNINLNNKAEPVCASDWTEKEADMVCKELKCGKMLKNEKRTRPMSGIIDHVKCEGTEASLWHCRAKHHPKLSCSSIPYVVCAENMDVKLVDGPGKCAGRLEVQQEGRWKQVRSGWGDKNSDNVCKLLKCGNKSRKNSDKFRKGKGDLLTMKCSENIAHISECSTQNNQAKQQEDAVEITCDEHKIVFLGGNEACSGDVGIEQGEQTFWLSGSNETWNQVAADTVCQQLHCGKAKTFQLKSYNGTTPVWNKTYSCSSNDKSLFECNTTPLPDSNQTIAHVTCTGNITLELKNRCWGDVLITAEGKTGGIYADTWTQDMSTKLCEELNCGDAIEHPTSQSDQKDVIFKSLHARSENTTLNKYTFVKREDNENTGGNKAYVICKGSIKPRFAKSRDKCSGNVEIQYEGKWHPVFKSSLENSQTQNAICKKLNCGRASNFSTYFGPTAGVEKAIKINCPQQKFSSCEITLEKTTKQIDELGALQCSDWKKIALEVDDACKGEVSVYTKGDNEDKRSVVSSQGWTETEGKRLCRDMNCKEYKTHRGIPLDGSETLWNNSFNCSDKAESIWDCERKKAPSSDSQKLYIECGAEPSVKFSKKCFGELTIDGYKVCDSQWKLEYSHMICQQLNCGNAIEGLLESKTVSDQSDYQYVHCDEHNYIIGQCKRVSGKCQKPVSISCTGSIKFNTTEKCGGQIKINYQNDEKELCVEADDKTLSKYICQENGCGWSGTDSTRISSIKVSSELSLKCPNTYRDMRYCVKKQTCTDSSVSSIICTGYQPVPPPQPSKPPDLVSILLGVGIVLILVILIVIFIRYRIVMRNRKSRLSSNMLPEQEGEEESGEYEDVDKSDEIERFGGGRFRSESEIKRDKDVESNASFSYDDIDEVTEAVPLTSPGSMDAAPKDKLSNRSNDGVTYEVDDAQENYDDIDASPEVVQTRAEVHDGPETAPETDAPAPSPAVQQDEDYLVPGQDG
ncbi:scavenger receptor cysteine-rich type 1 protein M130 [Kryptolebias marmoratus]|uniref:Scavenger receptor cysteine-rich type 1 protein M130-like n=1 Tax=Kryptolebias marmoratus TaxID=37003 RepID=A0A3Q3A421_KRYMA|nr:scavenger receptor cysteine-rich type 1 protein M130 [Kryptolebias marmoratus]